MNGTISSEVPVDGAAMDDGPKLIDALITLARYKKMLLGLPLAVAVLSAGLSLLIPNEYRSSTRILPPQQAQSGAAALLAQLGGVAGAAAAGAGIKNPNDLYVGMLKSRTVADNMIQRFNLSKVYDQEYKDKTRKELELNTTITTGKDGMIVIEVEDEDRRRAAEMANAYTEELLKLTRTLAVTEAAQRRVFFERQLQQSKDNLARAEIQLKEGLVSHGVVSVDNDSRAIVETGARLRAQISAKEVQLNAMRAFVTSSNPEFRRVQEELSSSRAELAKLENGSGAATPGGARGLENIKLLRDVKYHQMLYELLSKQYEIARLDEAKEASIVQVLDKAQEAERKHKPKRAIIVLLSTVGGFVLAVLLAFALDLHRKAYQQEGFRAKWDELRTKLRWKNT
jgi:uncharacterized protein involved in exopolysaccharide biosynthesis